VSLGEHPVFTYVHAWRRRICNGFLGVLALRLWDTFLMGYGHVWMDERRDHEEFCFQVY
jgi:hypothetical protein